MKSWQYSPVGSRDISLDFLRGYLIFAMVVDHIGGDSWLHALTGGDQFVVSAAEGFVLISGLVMGMVYRRIIRREGLAGALRKLLSRAAKLYALHAILTLGFITLSNLAGAPWSQPIENRIDYVVGVLTLRQTYYLTDIIHLYAILVLIAAPIALVLLARGHALLALLGSGMLWAIYQQYPYEMSSITTNLAFPAAAWQLYFVIGLVMGYHRTLVWSTLGRVPRSLALPLLCGVAVAFFAQHISGNTLFLADGWSGESYESIFYKYDVRPGRLVALAFFAPLAYLLAGSLWRPLVGGLGWALLPMGQNALLAYSMHLPVTLLAALVSALVPTLQGNEQAINSFIQLMGVGLVWLMIKSHDLPLRALPSKSPLPRTCSRVVCQSARLSLWLCAEYCAGLNQPHAEGEAEASAAAAPSLGQAADG